MIKNPMWLNRKIYDPWKKKVNKEIKDHEIILIENTFENNIDDKSVIEEQKGKNVWLYWIKMKLPR